MAEVVEAAAVKGDLERLSRQPKFAWYFEERPEPDITDEFFLGAFWQLGTCRSIGMGPGPIPWTAIKDYALHHRLEPDVTQAFIQIITALDGRYLKWVADEMPKPEGKG